MVQVGQCVNALLVFIAITPAIETRIALGRKTTYAHMGVHLYGLNGQSVSTSAHIYSVFVLPQVTYSLECVQIGNENTKSLEI